AVIAGLGVAGVGTAVAAGALAMRGRESALRRIRGWLLPAWTLLSLGLALIAHGGYAYAAAGMPWAWTPLSIVAFVAWGVASAALHRGAPRQWRVGEHLAHVGAAAVLVGVAAGAFSSAQSFAVRTGQDANVAGGLGGHWRFESQGVSRYGAADHDVTAVTFESWRNGAPKGLIVSQRLDYGTDQSDAPPVTVLRPALRSSGLADMRVTVDSTAGDLAYVRVQFVPLAWLLWLGAALLVLGGGAAMLPVAGGGAGGNA
ncbi:MAG: hypothetical protein KGL93_09155, partial [Gemmatimonadota bacterium]|nr:hypothetical protein [Gemmatimonadota bacterium]